LLVSKGDRLLREIRELAMKRGEIGTPTIIEQNYIKMGVANPEFLVYLITIRRIGRLRVQAGANPAQYRLL